MTPSNPHLIGQIAVEEGLLTPEQLKECLRLQEASSPPRPLGDVAVERGFLTKEQAGSLARIQENRFEKIAGDPGRGGLFGQLAVRLGFVTPERLHECLRDQAARPGDASSLRLGQLLLKKGYLTPEQLIEILRRQSKQVAKCPRCDSLYDVGEKGRGSKFVCSSCGAVVRAPAASTRIRKRSSV